MWRRLARTGARHLRGRCADTPMVPQMPAFAAPAASSFRQRAQHMLVGHGHHRAQILRAAHRPPPSSSSYPLRSSKRPTPRPMPNARTPLLAPQHQPLIPPPVTSSSSRPSSPLSPLLPPHRDAGPGKPHPVWWRRRADDVVVVVVPPSPNPRHAFADKPKSMQQPQQPQAAEPVPVQPPGRAPDYAACNQGTRPGGDAPVVIALDAGGAGSPPVGRPPGGSGGASGGAAGGGGGGFSSGSNSAADSGQPGPLSPPNWFIWAFRRYIRLLEDAPLRTKMITSGLLGAFSDIIAQKIERANGRGQDDIRWRRVAALAAVGALLTAPMFHVFYDFIDSALPGSVKGWRAWRNTALQLAADQLVAAPVWLVTFYAMFSVFENGQVLTDQISAQIQRDFVPSMKLTWAVFPIFQLFSFVVLPTKLRVLVLNVVDLGYVAALSFLQHT